MHVWRRRRRRPKPARGGMALAQEPPLGRGSAARFIEAGGAWSNPPLTGSDQLLRSRVQASSGERKRCGACHLLCPLPAAAGTVGTQAHINANGAPFNPARPPRDSPLVLALDPPLLPQHSHTPHKHRSSTQLSRPRREAKDGGLQQQARAPLLRGKGESEKPRERVHLAPAGGFDERAHAYTHKHIHTRRAGSSSRTCWGTRAPTSARWSSSGKYVTGLADLLHLPPPSPPGDCRAPPLSKRPPPAHTHAQAAGAPRLRGEHRHVPGLLRGGQEAAPGAQGGVPGGAGPGK